MRLKLRRDKNDYFGFVEKFDKYSYIRKKDEGDSSALSMKVVVKTNPLTIVEPFIYRGEEFIPAKVIEQEMGIAKYIRAKKPFYSVVNIGDLIVDMRVAYDGDTGEYWHESSRYSLFLPDLRSVVYAGDMYYVDLTRIPHTSENIEKLMYTLGETVAKCRGDREKFLRQRMGL